MTTEPEVQTTSPAIIVVASIAAGALALLLPLPEGLSESARMAGVIGAVMAALWMSEAVPLQVTALLPLAAFPVSGVASLELTARAYAHPLIFLFLGGFMLAAAMQRWNLHLRLALTVLAVSGPRPRNQVMAMMVSTALLSFWISNTATAMVMVPIGLSLVAASRERTGVTESDQTRQSIGDDEQDPTDQFGPALMLGIAFAATIGGMGSLIGTPPNALLAGFLQQSYAISIGFAQWMLVGIPVVIVLLPIAWLVLTRFVFRLTDPPPPAVSKQITREKLTQGQWRVAAILAATAALWIFRPLISSTFGISGLSDAGIAVTSALLLFLLPERFPGGRPLLTWEEVKTIRWDVLILFGGGLALAEAIGSTGLAAWISSHANILRDFPVALLVLVMMTVIVYLGELASNTAMAAIFLPIAGATAISLGLDPLALLLPVTLAASLGFMLPVATPPNAIVYGTGAVSARQMLRAGALLDVVSIFIVYAMAMILGPLVF